MFICPTCAREYHTEEEVVKHYLACWKARNPIHHPTPAPHSEDIITRTNNSDVGEFFAKLKGGK